VTRFLDLAPGARTGYRMGVSEVYDCMVKDGLWDPYDNSHMGGVADLCAKENLVLATGGGSVLDAENRRVMREGALVVHLDAPPEILNERMARDPVTGEQRPALTTLDALSEMKAMAEKRAPLYAEARHVVVDTNLLDAERAAQAILDEVEAR